MLINIEGQGPIGIGSNAIPNAVIINGKRGEGLRMTLSSFINFEEDLFDIIQKVLG